MFPKFWPVHRAQLYLMEAVNLEQQSLLNVVVKAPSMKKVYELKIVAYNSKAVKPVTPCGITIISVVYMYINF